MRKHRKGEYVCNCSAYHFPHRWGGGRCSPFRWVAAYWETYMGGAVCASCHCYAFGECQVDVGIEDAAQCAALEDFVLDEEITPPKGLYKHKRRRHCK